jgi:hypothetical protein
VLRRAPGPDRLRQKVRTLPTVARSLLATAHWLSGIVTRVVMRTTIDSARPPFYLLKVSFQTWPVNAGAVRHQPTSQDR